MAATGYTPIQLYYSTTASTAPSSSNLVSGELAINILDEKLYFKNSSGTVKLLASTAGSNLTVGTTSVTSGTSGYILYNNSGTLGNLATTGSGSVVLATSPTFTTSIDSGATFGAFASSTTLTEGYTGTGASSTHNIATGALTGAFTKTVNIGTGGTTGSTTTINIGSTTSGTTTVNGTLTLGTALAATSGGTAQSTYTTGDILYASATNTLSKLAIGTAGQILTVASGLPSWGAAASSGVTTITFGSTGLTPSTATSGAVSVAGTLVAANGGTGQSSYAVGDLLYASTTTALSKLADVATGNALISGGVTTAPSWGKIGLTTHVSGTLPIANGGTGSTSTTYCSLTSNVTGTLPIANGGTNNGSLAVTAGGVFYSDGTSFQNVGAGTSGYYLKSNGASAPTWAAVSVSAFPSGTRMSFQQTSAPTGWTKDTTAAINDSILRLVTGTVSSGGTTAFSTWNAQTASGATTLSTPQIPSHSHSIGGTGFGEPRSTSGYLYGQGYTIPFPDTGAAGGGGSHTHSLTQSIKYYDFIIASAN